MRSEAQALRARLWLDLGDLAAAERWIQTGGARADADPVYEREAAYLLLARLRIAQGRPDEALPLLDSLRQGHEAAGRTGRAIAVWVLVAVARWAAGAREGALDALAEALCRAEPEGYIRLVVEEGAPMAAMLATILGTTQGRHRATWRGVSLDYPRALLAACGRDPDRGSGFGGWAGQGRAAATDGLAEPLSAREQEVLHLLAAGLINEEIARRLFVTAGTVKTHLKSIYGKLGVHTRTEAVARARALMLL
jgi:LuxR family maltose regulon positive regulatory protein